MSGWLLLAGAAAISTLLTWFARGIARKTGFVAKPNPLVPSHTEAVAYMGGTGIAATALVGLGVAIAFGTSFPLAWWIGGLGFLLVGLWDDLRAPGPRNKLIVQALVSVLTAASYGAWLPPAYGWAEIPLATLVLLTAVNAVNLTDVSDGLVGGLSIIVLLALAALLPSSPIPWVLAGSTVGFLVWNRAPASIYLGDAGSHLLGAALALLSLDAFAASPGLRSAGAVVAIEGVFLFELAFLTVIRARKGLPFWRGSPDHFALRLQAGGFSRMATALMGWTGGALMAAIGLAFAWAPWGGVVAALAVWVVAIVLVVPVLLRWEVKPKRSS